MTTRLRPQPKQAEVSPTAKQSALQELSDQKFALDQHAIVAVTDVQGAITYVNDKFCAISQYSKEELIGQNHRILNSGHHPKEFFQQMYRTIGSGKVWHGEIKNRAKDGSIYWVDTTIVPTLTREGKPRQYVAIRADITERKRAEAALIESLATSDQALKELADQKFALDQHAIVAVTDVQGTITYVNDKFCAISQYSKEELIGQNHRILNSGYHSKEFFLAMYRAIANGKVWHGKIKNRAKGGSYYWVDTTIVPFMGQDGKPRQYVAIRADITERKRGEEDLRESQERFRLLLDGVKDYAIYMLDPEGYVISWNAGAARIKGYQNEEILGKHFSCFYVPEDCVSDKPTRELRESLAKGRFEEEARRVRKDGTVFWANVVITPMYDDRGVHTGFSKVACDITERKRAAEALQESLVTSEAALKELADQKFALDEHAIVAMTDVQGTITYVNDKFCAISQYSKEELIGQNHRILNSGYHPKEFFLEMYRTIANGKVWHGEIKNRAKDGSIYWVETTIVPFVGTEGKPRQYVAIRADITERKRAEEEREKAKEAAEAASRSKSEFLANMSHEIRTPLNGVIGMTDLILGTELSAEQREFMETIKMSADSLLNVINNILDFSKIEVGKIDIEAIDFNLRRSLEDTLKTLAFRADERGLELLCEIAPEVPEVVRGDSARLQQVVVNLVGNAIKFTAKGEVALKVQLDRDGGEGCILHFVVADTGIGISPEKQKLIFEAFTQADTSTTRKYGGTGLGLAISKNLVEMMGGEMWVESVVGQGTRFHFTVRPQWSEKANDDARTVTPPVLRDVKTLIVDDNHTNRRILEEMLKRWEMRPTSVGGGEEALAELSRARQVGAPYKLILTDLHMPLMDGFALIDLIRQRNELPAATIVMLTSADFRGSEERCRERGITSYLLKPVRQSELFSAILLAIEKNEAVARTVPVVRQERDAHAKALRILLAEDNRVNQRVAASVLEKMGHSLVVANNGVEALSILAAQSFDLVLMDIQMPEMDGLTATQKIREGEKQTQSHLPIIAMTAHAMQRDQARCLEAGMDGYVSKPIDRKALEQAISSVVQGLDVPGVGRNPKPEEMNAVPNGPIAWDPAKALERLDGDQQLLRAVIEIFLECTPQHLTSLRQAITQGDAEALAKIAHGLKGDLGYLGISELSDKARGLEEMGRKRNLEHAPRAFAVFETEICAIVASIRNGDRTTGEDSLTAKASGVQ